MKLRLSTKGPWLKIEAKRLGQLAANAQGMGCARNMLNRIFSIAIRTISAIIA
jgi:hypothetical protein